MRWRWWTACALSALLCAGCDDGGEGGEGGGGGEADMGEAGAGGEAGGGGEGAIGGEGGGEPQDAAVDAAPRRPACADELDNDGDGLTDLDDPGCEGPEDDDELNPAECADEIDNDQDGFVDYPDDPGCGSEFDDDEFNEPPTPQCADGIDNDRDGLVDEQDPGCSSPADPREVDPEEAPQCANGLDDDGDGVIDFPLEPGCGAAGDDDEVDPPTLPGCANGLDDDGDELADYPNDPGCAGVGDRDEADKPIVPACFDGVDNDRDGKIDFPEDDGCLAASDYSERGACGTVYDPPSLQDGGSIVVDTARGVFETQGSCGGRGSPEVAFQYRLARDVEALEISTVGPGTQVPTTLYVRRSACLDEGAEVACHREDADADPLGHTLVVHAPTRGDYYIFADGVAGAGGPVQITVNEVPLAQCLNGLDDDEDGRIDYPADPGCDEPNDRDETSEGLFPACANDEDDDGDGQVDYPLDMGCISAASDSEVDACGQGVRFQEFFFDQGFVIDDLSENGTSALRGACGGQNANEIIYFFNNPFNARLEFSTAHPETEVGTVLYVRRDCAEQASEIQCDDGQAAGAMNGRVVIENAAVGPYWVIVDSRIGLGGRFKLSLEIEREDPGCADGRDNDQDGRVDGEDPGCATPDDEDERDPAGPPPACNNGDDDDDDGLIDYPYDPGCLTRGFDDEADPPEPPACANGLDDDGDGQVDFPFDPGCQARGDDEEIDPRPRPACNNRIDDDMDGAIDYPFDPGCEAAGDGSEEDVGEAICANGRDDDRDGIADFPFDPGCLSAADPDETDEEEPPVCSNGVDDDGDGRVDFPVDYGCRWAADPSEANPGFPPQCANERDDDNDGRADFPDDPGCRFAADPLEENEGEIPPRCSDGVDNDLDGAIDLADLGCTEPEDDDEADPPEVPLCGNMADDDGDMLADWPDDPGCQAAGDLTEDQSCRPGVETPLIPRNGRVMGATAEGGADRYRSRCGGREAPDVVYRYTLAEQADLRISAAHPGTDYPVILSVRNDCEEAEAMLACAGNFAAPDPEVLVRDAEPGEYYIIIDGGGPEQWVAGDGMVALADPRAYRANQGDIRANCGWSDAGNDAFDCYGNPITVSFGGASVNIDPSLGERNYNAGAYGFRVRSSFASQNIWRLEFLPQQDFDEREVSLAIAGNLGSDGSTVDRMGMVDFEGRQVRYLYTADSFAAPRDPPITHMLLPSDPEQLAAVNYMQANGVTNITAQNIKLPATLYIAPSYAAEATVAQAMLSDVQVQAGAGGGDAPRFGNFELSVTEE